MLGKIIKGVGLNRWAGFVLIAALLVMRQADPGFVENLRNQAFDAYQQLKPRDYQALPVTIVDIDERSIEELGQWPWPRNKLAELVTKMTQAGAAAIAFDIVFSEPDRLSPEKIAEDNSTMPQSLRDQLAKLPSNDQVFAKAIANSRIVLGQASVRQASDNREEKLEVVDVAYGHIGPDPKPNLVSFGDIVQNLPVLEKAALGRGVFAIKSDRDGVYRRVPLVVLVQDKVRLGLSMELLRVTTQRKFAIQSNAAGIEKLRMKGFKIDTDAKGRVWPYLTPTQPSRFVSVADILSGKTPAARLRGHLVLVGTSATGLEDYRASSLGVQMAGVEIHAQVLENVLTKTLLVRPNYSIAVELAVLLALTLLVVILVPYLGALWSIICAVVLLGGYIGVSYAAFHQYRLLIDPTYPVAGTILTFMLMASANYFQEERKRQEIRSAFGQYVSPALVDQLSDEPDRLKLGGETRELSVLFSDVRGFTAISESFKDNPQGLTELMNTFLTALSDAILKHNGTIDKFMGDAVMAFWNAPLDTKDHAVASANAAIDMLKAVSDLNAQIEKDHAAAGNPDVVLHNINVGIGINTGNCVVGNMGSRNRFDYTALGDTVNIASRLEGQSKPYGIAIVIGANTAEQISAEMAVMEIDQIRVKGKNEPERIFGLFGNDAVKNSADFIAARGLNRTMLMAYRSQDWANAFEALGMLREIEDRLALGIDEYLFIYETRIAEFRANPPGNNWDGVYTATSK